MPSILFVCTANQFRSPLAAAKFSRMLSTKELEREWTVSSAGTWAEGGLPLHPKAIQAAAKLGLTLKEHTTREVNKDMLNKADLIVVMEHGHREALESEFPECKERICLLSEVAGGSATDIDDPARTNFAEADAIAQRILDEVQKACVSLMDLARRNQAARSVVKPQN